MPTSLLEILTTPDVTPEILRRRAKHWAIIADRLDGKRAAEAERIRANARAMLMQANSGPNVVQFRTTPKAALPPAVPPAKPRPETAPMKNTFSNAAQFLAAVTAARRGAEAELGPMWGSVAGAAIWARLPAKWLAGTGHRYRDWRLPAARFWETGELPIGAEYAPPAPPPRAPHPEACGVDRMHPDHAEMLRRHAADWGLVEDAHGHLTSPAAAAASLAHLEQIDRTAAEQLLQSHALQRHYAERDRLQDMRNEAARIETELSRVEYETRMARAA